MGYGRALPLMAIVVQPCACAQSSAADAGSDGAATSDAAAVINELEQLAIDSSNASADASQAGCDCGLTCGHPLRMSQVQASCYLVQAAGQFDLYRQYFEESRHYFRAVAACHADGGCAATLSGDCQFAPPEILRTPPDFVVLAAAVCVE